MAIEFRTRSKAIQPDSEDRGACCTVSGDEYICQPNVRYIDCKRDLGVFRGKDSTCSNQGCPGIVTDPETPLNSDLHGACKTCSSCTNNLLIEDCITQTNFDAEFFSNKLCSEVERDNLSSIVDTKHACCIQDGSCFNTCNSDYCSNLGGIYHDGIQTQLALQCDSNPCGDIDNITSIGACCRAGRCVGQLTQVDCVRNNGTWIGDGTDCSVGGDYDCETGTFIEDRTRTGSTEQQNREPNGLGDALLVCSSPTPKKYYNLDGLSNLTLGPTYSSEPVWVNLLNTVGECDSRGGIVSA